MFDYWFLSQLFFLIGVVFLFMAIYNQCSSVFSGALLKKDNDRHKGYEACGNYEMHGKTIYQKKLIEKNMQILSDRGVNLDKIRFVFQPCFVYDFITDEVNPKFEMVIPTLNSGLIDKNREPITIREDERDSRMLLSVNNCRNVDWQSLTIEINKSNKGFVFFIANESEDYHFETDTEYVRYINLDSVSFDNLISINKEANN